VVIFLECSKKLAKSVRITPPIIQEKKVKKGPGRIIEGYAPSYATNIRSRFLG